MKQSDQNLFASLRALPRPAWILFFGTFLNKFGTFVLPFLTLYVRDIGYSTADAGLAIASYAVGNLLASLVGGYLADSMGRRKTIVLSMFSGAAAMLLLSQAHSLPWIFVFAGLVGLTGELYRPAANALLTDLVPPERRMTAFSVYRTAFNAGWACGPAAAGFLASHGYLWLFVGDAATTLLFGFVALFALPKHTGVGKSSPEWSAALRVMRRDRKFQQLLLAVLCLSFVMYQASTTLSLYITGLGFSPSVYGYILSLNGVMVMCCELPLTTVRRRFEPRNVIAVGFLLMGTAFALYAFAHTVPAFAWCMALITLGEMLAMPVASAYVANLSPADMRGRYAGVYSLTWGLTLIFAPGVGMRLLAHNPTVLWVTCGMLGLLSAGIVLVRVKGPVPQGVALAQREAEKQSLPT